MGAELLVSMSAVRGAIVEARRSLRYILSGPVRDAEDALAKFASDWFPIAEPRLGTPERGQIGVLLDVNCWYLRYQGKPVVSRGGGSKLDEVLEPLGQLFCMTGASTEDLLDELARRLRYIQQLRGREGVIYGLITYGTTEDVLDETGLTRPLDRFLVQDDLDDVAWAYLDGLDAVFAIFAQFGESELAWRRASFAQLVRSGADDYAFSALVEGWPRALLGKLMANPARPRKVTWRNLVGRLLGVAVSEPLSAEPHWWLHMAESLDEFPPTARSETPLLRLVAV